MQIVCVNKANYCGRGQVYVEVLYNMVAANMPDGVDYRFTCFTDDEGPYAPGIELRPLPEGLEGWFNKLYLFSPGLFDEGERIFFLDLDTLVTGPLAPFLAYDGDFALLGDFWRPKGYGSGVMLWRAGYATELWESFEEAGRPKIKGGDQVWVERHLPQADILQRLYPGLVLSYKDHCLEALPLKAAIVCFHGLPRPHQVTNGWVPLFWRAPLAAPAVPGTAKVEADFWRAEGVGHIIPKTSLPDPEGFAPGPYVRSFFTGFDSVVEIGCGAGRLAGAFAPERYTGLDINVQALVAAKLNLPDYTFLLLGEDDAYPACDGLYFYTVLLHVNDDMMPILLQRAATAARRIVIAEIMDRRWRRPGNPPVFNRDAEDYIMPMNRLGFTLIASERRPYARYNTPEWWNARDTRLTILAFERA